MQVLLNVLIYTILFTFAIAMICDFIHGIQVANAATKQEAVIEPEALVIADAKTEVLEVPCNIEVPQIESVNAERSRGVEILESNEFYGHGNIDENLTSTPAESSEPEISADEVKAKVKQLQVTSAKGIAKLLGISQKYKSDNGKYKTRTLSQFQEEILKKDIAAILDALDAIAQRADA